MPICIWNYFRFGINQPKLFRTYRDIETTLRKPKTFIKYLEQFSKLDKIEKSNDVGKLRTFSNKIELATRNLRSVGIETSSFINIIILLLSVPTSNLLMDLRTLFVWKFSGNVWLLDELLVILKNELEAKERSVNPGDKHFKRGEFARYKSTTSVHISSELIKSNCVFCSSNSHNSNRCAKVTGPSTRKQIIFQKNLSYICMSSKHKAWKCNANYICKKCNCRHYSSICQKGNLKYTRRNNSGSGNNSANVTFASNEQAPSTINSQQLSTKSKQSNCINPANMVTNFSGNSYKNILLQTVNAEVVNLDNRNCEKCDSGA